MENPNNIVIEMHKVAKYFGDNKVLKDINLQLIKGENLAVIGKSGTGKSVLIKCLVRLMEPDEGNIMVLGKDICAMKSNELNEIRKKMGFLFQSAALYDSMTVRENLEFPLRELPRKERHNLNERVEEALQNVGLLDTIDQMPAELSGGMRKRLGLARSLILNPEIMLYDEPTTGLDPITSKEISQLILEVQKKYNTSSIIITHDMECVRITSNRIAVINEGKCTAQGSYQELEKSEDKGVRPFFE